MGGSWQAIQGWPNTDPSAKLCAIHGVHLPNNRIVMWGGPDIPTSNKVWLWDPTISGSAAFTRVDNPHFQCYCGGHAMQEDGACLVMGGQGSLDGIGLVNADALSPVGTSAAWSARSNMGPTGQIPGYERSYPSATTPFEE
jgi:hypothetical protein